MKLRTRLIVAFMAIVVIPILLIVSAYGIVRMVLRPNIRQNYGLDDISVETLLNPVEGFGRMTEPEMDLLREVVENEPWRLEDRSFLNEINEGLSDKASALILIQGDKVIYNGGIKEELAEAIAGDTRDNNVTERDYYLRDYRAAIKSLCFVSRTVGECRICIVTTVTIFLSAATIIWICFAFLGILVATSAFLIMWIRRGVFLPVSELSEGMQHIADGDFDFVLADKGTGEIAALYENYNQMRLRLKETSEEQIRQDAQNRELISNISHDLKTPITSIKGYVEGIMDGVADTPEKMDRYIRTIYNKANDMNKLINELTIYSKIDANKIPYNFRKLNVCAYFDDCVEEVGLDLESKEIRLNYTNLVPGDTMIIADPEQLSRVVNNIISNSVKYMDKRPGIIDIRILDEVDSVRVEIEDNGKGVAAKELGNIFERFYRTDASRNSAQGGSGIGLSIVKKIVEDHGGYIWVTSKEGEGTCMHFVLRKYEEKDTTETVG